MHTTKLTLSFALLSLLVGCAGEVDVDEDLVVASPEDDADLAPLTQTGETPTSKCTTTTTCDKDYCCTSRVCTYSTVTECKPVEKPKPKPRTVSATLRLSEASPSLATQP